MPQRCLDCNNVTLPNDDTKESAKQCEHCLSTNLECDHPSGHYCNERYCFVCGVCGNESYHGLKELRKLTHNNSSLSDLKELLALDS